MSQRSKSIRTIHDGRKDLGVMIVMVDGTTRFLGTETKPDILKALLTIRGGERLDESDF